MTDRINAIVVILEENLRIDDAEPLLQAIKQMRGVLKVEPHTTNIDGLAAEVRARADIAQRLFELASTYGSLNR